MVVVELITSKSSKMIKGDPLPSSSSAFIKERDNGCPIHSPCKRECKPCTHFKLNDEVEVTSLVHLCWMRAKIISPSRTHGGRTSFRVHIYGYGKFGRSATNIRMGYTENDIEWWQ